MIVSTTDVKGSESLLDKGAVPVNKSASSESSGQFSDRLNENIAKNNNNIKEKVRANSQKSPEKQYTKEEASKTASRAEPQTSKTASNPLPSSQAEPSVNVQPSKGLQVQGGKSLPETGPQVEASLLDGAVEGEVAGLADPEQTEAVGLPQLIKQFSETVTEQSAAGSHEQDGQDDADGASTLPVFAPVSPVAEGTPFFGAESAVAAFKSVPGGEPGRILTQQALSNAADTHGHRPGDPAPGRTEAMDAVLQKSPLDMPYGLQKTMGLESDAYTFKWTESHAESALPKVSVTNRTESSGAYLNHLANQMLTDAVSASDKISLDRPITHVRWSQDLGERVQWMMSRSMNGAEIRLNPPQLGPMEVRIQMQQDQASVAFTSQHASVREAIEAALPRLREMLGQQSLNLVNVDISQHSFSDQRQQGQMGDGHLTESPWTQHADSDPDLTIEQADTTWSGPVYDGLINTYV